MMDKRFSNWKRWAERDLHNSINHPGVYALVMTANDISGEPFSWRKEIVYFGMTNSKGGLKSRLQQFSNTIKGGEGHGGARRFRFKFDYADAEQQLFVAVCPQDCDVDRLRPSDLRIMGEIASYEYECLAEYVEKYTELPIFNNPASPKK
jgi:hypothetical protein